VSSKAHKRTNGINFEDFHSKESYKPFVVYMNSKLANIYFTKILQEKMLKAKIKGISVCLHPGVVRT
jgi:NAD(P)-dependent dehydrogenase (short-subunit alcohol dehydrogenase family)